MRESHLIYLTRSRGGTRAPTRRAWPRAQRARYSIPPTDRRCPEIDLNGVQNVPRRARVTTRFSLTRTITRRRRNGCCARRIGIGLEAACVVIYPKQAIVGGRRQRSLVFCRAARASRGGDVRPERPLLSCKKWVSSSVHCYARGIAAQGERDRYDAHSPSMTSGANTEVSPRSMKSVGVMVSRFNSTKSFNRSAATDGGTRR